MKDNEIYNEWCSFINDEKYMDNFISNEEIWRCRLEMLKKFIDENHRRPSSKSKNTNTDEKKLGQWLSVQIKNSKPELRTDIMKDNEIYNEWCSFINDEKYKVHFLSNEEVWRNNLQLLMKFIEEHQRRPSSKSKNAYEKKLAKWLSAQISNSKPKSRKQIMKDDEIYKLWNDFITDEKYNKYFK
jgi:hypothetical protein